MAKLDFARRDDYGLFLIVHYAALAGDPGARSWFVAAGPSRSRRTGS